MSIHDEIKGKAKGQDTEATRAMMGRPAHAPHALLADGDTNERLEPGYDQFTVTAQDRADAGLREDESPRWIRDPRIWKAHEMGDRARSFLHMNPGGRIVLKDGQFVTNGDDLILAAVPRELETQAQQA